MAKAPFERVFSLIERKKLLKKVAHEKIKIILKNSLNDVMELRVTGIDEAFNLEGQILGRVPRDFEKVTALFYVDGDRYFLTTRLKRKPDGWILLNDTALYKFNRRNAFRVRIPPSIELNFFVSTVRNIEINRNINVIDFSSGGARIHWYNDKKISVGTHIRGVLQWGKGKVLPVEGVVQHSPEPGVYGIRFVNMNSTTINRLKLLSVEIQQTIQFG